MRDVGGTAADVDDYRLVPLAAFGVVMHGRSGGFFKEIDLVEAGLGGGLAQDVQRLVVAGRADRTAELHRAPEQGGTQRAAKLGAGGQADVFKDVRGDAGDGLPGARVQVYASSASSP
ncbi:hypothetical protein G6F40_015390 [Rhizopus arrhizus]|nr:hypothetical protein G6F40_015390 [Rhizopus arrhizus]